MMRSIFFLALGLLSGCQTAPTQLHEQSEARTKDGEQAVAKNIVFLDARPPFVLTTSPIPQATPLQWRDFATRQPPFENALEGDLYFHARRIARMGIKPETPVIVLGRGAQGEGEEGRLAWTLKYLGVKDVKFVSSDNFRFPPQWLSAPEHPPVAIWKPELQSDLLIGPKELRSELKSDSDLLLVEVVDGGNHRLDSKQVGRHVRKEVKWSDLVSMKEEKRAQFLTELLGSTKSPIVVVDSDGVKAASMTLWLRDAGYPARLLAVGTKSLFK